MIVNEIIFRDQGRAAKRRFANDDAIERIFGPGLGTRRGDDFGQGSVGELQTDPLGKILDHLLTGLVDTADFPQQVNLQYHHRRYGEIVLVHRATGSLTQQRRATGVEPHRNVGIYIGPRRHSFDQST